MKKFRNFLPAILFAVSVSLLAGLASVYVSSLILGSNASSDTVSLIYKLTASAVALIFLVVYSVRLGRAVSHNNRIHSIMAEEGVTPELLSMLKNQADKAKDSATSGMANLMLASYLVEGGYFRQCFEILEKIDREALPARYQEEYFNVYVYANLMMGDIETADGIYKANKSYFERAMLRESNMPVLHTLGVLEYAKGNYIKAENLLMQAKNNSQTKQGRCECNLYLGLCYLKTDRADYARLAVIEASKQASTVYQRRDLEKLKKLVENAYTNFSE